MLVELQKMLALLAGLLASAIAVEGAALPAARSTIPRQEQDLYTLPQFDDNEMRAAGLRAKREGWAYGPSIAGNTSFYPIGTLGDAAVKADNEVAFAFRE